MLGVKGATMSKNGTVALRSAGPALEKPLRRPALLSEATEKTAGQVAGSESVP